MEGQHRIPQTDVPVPASRTMSRVPRMASSKKDDHSGIKALTYSGPVSKHESRMRRFRYRFHPPAQSHFNRFQRVIWRTQRLVLGDNRRRKAKGRPGQ